VAAAPFVKLTGRLT